MFEGFYPTGVERVEVDGTTFEREDGVWLVREPGHGWANQGLVDRLTRLTRELEAVMDLARPKAGGGAGGSSDRSGLELRLLLAVAACLLLLLLWPLLSGSLGANGAGSPSGSGVDTSAGGPSRHPASGLLQPDP